MGGNGMEGGREYKLIKVKTSVRLYSNPDPTMKLVRKFEEKSAELGH